MYAVIEDSGTQIKVTAGDVIRIAKRELGADQATLTFDKVLFVGGEGSPKIGAPVVAGAQVQADILGEGRTDKVRIVKFRKRKNYRRINGHRQDFIQVRITGITA
jgi:large subunit ribosomal protein L21